MIRTVNFGEDYSNLTTVSYKLINSDGSIYQSETTTGVFEVQMDSGIYGVNIEFGSQWNGIILWSTGEDDQLFASEDIYYNTDTTSIIDIITEIDNKSDIIINTTNDIDNKIDELSIDCTNLSTVINDIDNKIDILNVQCNEISNDLKRLLGLCHEDIFIDLPTYDSADNLIGARVRIYSNSNSVGSNSDIIGTYTIEVNTKGEPGKFYTWSQLKI